MSTVKHFRLYYNLDLDDFGITFNGEKYEFGEDEINLTDTDLLEID